MGGETIVQPCMFDSRSSSSPKSFLGLPCFLGSPAAPAAPSLTQSLSMCPVELDLGSGERGT